MADMKTPTNIAFGTDGWRAIMNDEFIFDNLALVAQSVADFINEKGTAKQGVVIGWDAALHVRGFRPACRERADFQRHSRVAARARYPPTPVIAYTVLNRKMAGGIMISASHNPPKYNGIKFIPDYGHPALPEITDKLTAGVKKLQADGTTPNRSGNTALMEKFDPKPEYFAHLSKLFNLDAISNANLKIWYDPLYATGRGYIDEFLRNIGVDVTTIHGERNPLFGGSLPDPNEKNLAEIARRVGGKRRECRAWHRRRRRSLRCGGCHRQVPHSEPGALPGDSTLAEDSLSNRQRCPHRADHASGGRSRQASRARRASHSSRLQVCRQRAWPPQTRSWAARNPAGCR